MQKNSKTVLILFVVLGIAALGYGIYVQFFETRGFSETLAKIEDIEEFWEGTDADGHDDYRYEVTVSYRVNGQTYRGLADQYSSSYTVGKQIRIRYDPENPATFHVVSRFGLVLMIVGPLVAAGAGYALYREKRKSGE